MTVLDEALRYRNMNLSVIPVGKDKKPLIPWKEYQDRHATLEEITKWFSNPDTNIAIVTGKISGITVLDCDSQDAINAFREMYKGMTAAVRTPRGMHFYYRYEEGVRNTVKVGNLDMDVRGEGGYVLAPPSVNAQGQEYTWHSSLSSLHALDSFSFLNNIYNARARGGETSHNDSHESQRVTEYFIKGRRDEDLFHVANCLIKGGAETEITRQVLETLALSCNPPFPEKEIEAKIQSAIERGRRKERNIMAEIKEWLESQTGHFRVTDYHNESHLVTRQEKHTANVAFTRLCEQGILERYGERSGTYRKVENDVEVIDWMNAETEEYPVQFPLNIHTLVKLYPGNIAILAGASNTGKTTFMLELIRLNQKRHKILYMNSEMGASELKLRLEMFHEVCPLSKWSFKAVERSEKFADAVDPDGFNVIDFMEIYDEFWRLGGWIRDVHKKLNKGIAIIAIQKQSSSKKEQKDFGRGGELTIEKPRLYLAMDRGRIKIVKAKIWRSHDRNPNGLTRDFKIVSGWKFIGSDEWQGEEDRKYAPLCSTRKNDPDFPREN